ncbi:hypothetical protein AVDCRST_MAG94-5937 [uncultured Leptolyngbya sp.]|uniref:Uncharacterized protein n=1 Tax=uncultured Leptolyngbya sp. TaxID=332963 RepID=A0A6J4P5C7_9CYAN|nr:hypothetical protein AVDCRST_MAG94-5937 [uncultured Leptolyngbya sp.]
MEKIILVHTVPLAATPELREHLDLLVVGSTASRLLPQGRFNLAGIAKLSSQ